MEKRNLLDLLKGNPYPGRGIVLGKSGDGKQAVAVYFIMGRSENSRNRVFVPTEDGIRTEAHDPSKMTDPSLIIYHPVRKVSNELIVTNGDQTDTVPHLLRQGLRRLGVQNDPLRVPLEGGQGIPVPQVGVEEAALPGKGRVVVVEVPAAAGGGRIWKSEISWTC